MTAREQVLRAQRALQISTTVSALLWGATAGLAVSVGMAAARDMGWDRGAIAGAWAPVIPAFAVVLLLVWRWRAVWSERRVALWLEEHVPALEYALVTASDPAIGAGRIDLERIVSRTSPLSSVGFTIARPSLYAMGAALVALSALLLTSAGVRTDVAMARHSALQRLGISTPIPSRIATVSVRITPPRYSDAATRNLDDPSDVTALVGSGITVSGPGGRVGISAMLATHKLRAGGDRDAWSVSFTMPSAPATLTLRDRSFRRVIAVIPVPDGAPTVALMAPASDTVWRTPPGGSIVFAARATDDVGLASGRFEYTVTSGAGEIFKARSGTFGSAAFGGSRSGDMRAALPLAQLALAAGDVLSVRAIVADGNTVTGPGVTASDTRTLRVARADEYDSLAVEGAAPPPLESSFLTERMLIISAESLLTKRASLRHDAFVQASGSIGLDQSSLRKKVYNIVYGHEEAGGAGGVESDNEETDPQLVINQDLRKAYDAMWDAERALMVGEIPTALPSMRKALSALDRARLANRLYVRGRSRRVVVNVEKVRLAGKERGASSVSSSRSRADSVTMSRMVAFDRALDLAARSPSAFADELTRLRADAASGDTSFARALGDAVDALRRGRDATSALIRARRALFGAPRTGAAALPWSGLWDGNP